MSARKRGRRPSVSASATPTVDRLVGRRLARITEDGDGHWMWPGASSRGGYARLRVIPRKAESAKLRDVHGHRAVWIALVGPIPDRYVLRSTCGVRKCVRPDHHRLVRFDWSPADDLVGVGVIVDATSAGGKAA